MDAVCQRMVKKEEENREKLRTMIEHYPKNYVRMMKTPSYSELYKCILEFTKWMPLDREWDLPTRSYLFLNNMTEFPKCENCENPILKNVVNVRLGFGRFCCRKCATSSETTIKKQMESCIAKFGVPHPIQSEEVKKRIRQTNFERYGVEHPMQSDEIKNRTIRTNLAKYGVEYTFQSEEVKEKIKQTNIERLGVGCVFQSEEVKERIRNTNLLNLGVEYPMQSSEVRRKSRNTCLKRYGVDNPAKDADVQRKTIETNMEKYGVERPAQNKDVQSRMVDTCLKIYGVENPFMSEEVKNKISETNLLKYGVEHPAQSEIVKARIAETNLERYGSESPFGNADVQNKIRQTNLERYGVENSSSRDEIKEKIKQTNMERYGVGCPFEQSWVKDMARRRLLKMAYDGMMKCVDDIPIFSFDEFVDMGTENPLKFKCLSCGKEFESIHRHGFHHSCPDCHPIANIGQSRGEIEVLEFIKSICANVEVLSKDRSKIKPLEIDILVPSFGLGIEYDGLYWHSEMKKGSKYHLDKTEMCEKAGLQLIHVFENEWMDKRGIVESRLKDLLGAYDKTIYARKCEVIEVPHDCACEFQDMNHIQGTVNAKVRLGLYYNGELVSLMTFGTPRFSGDSEWEMLRFCNKLGYHVPGGASKLLKHFEREYHPKSIVSYADRRWSRGKLYKRLGFSLERISSPNYWYFQSSGILESRVKYQKHKLKDILPKFDESKTEVQNMYENGYNRIFDCGNLVFVRRY